MKNDYFKSKIRNTKKLFATAALVFPSQMTVLIFYLLVDWFIFKISLSFNFGENL